MHLPFGKRYERCEWFAHKMNSLDVFRRQHTMEPFDSYPHGGREPFGRFQRFHQHGCRRGSGLKFQRLTKQTNCAYCGVSLVETFENWLMLSIDHVIPEALGRSISVPSKWL